MYYNLIYVTAIEQSLIIAQSERREKKGMTSHQILVDHRLLQVKTM